MTLHLGDCFDVLPTLAPGSVDLVFADLPYGVTNNRWDTPIDLARLWPLLQRVSKPNAAMVFTATQPFASALVNSNPKAFRYDLVWDKVQPTGHLNANRMPLRRHEHILVFYAARPSYTPQKTQGAPYSYRIGRASSNYGADRERNCQKHYDGLRHPTSIVRVPKEGRCHHPTKKPVALLEWLIKTYTLEGETVLDPVMGSASTAVACQNLGRKFIGIEKDPTYFAIGQQRLAVSA